MSRSTENAGSGSRRIRWKDLDLALAPFRAETVQRLAAAAADGPGSVHRLPSITLIWVRCVLRPPSGTRPATQHDLAPLLEAARAAAPAVLRLEDCWQCDPRAVVHYSAESDRLRIHPGPFTDPVTLLDVVSSLADAIDEVVLERWGFGLADTLEVGLRHMNHIVSHLAPVWPDHAFARDSNPPLGEPLADRVARIAEAPALVSAGELRRANGLALDLRPVWLDDCADVERAGRALDFLTRPVNGAVLDPSAVAPLGACLRVRSGTQARMVPAALGISCLLAAAAELANLVSNDNRASSRLAAMTSMRAASVLGADRATLSDQAEGDPATAFAESIVVVRGRRHATVVEIVSALTPNLLEVELTRARQRFEHIDVSKLQNRGLSISDNAELCGLVVYSGPCQLPFHPPSAPPVVHLSELEVICEEAFADEAPTAPLHFFEDLATESRLIAGSADLLDAWRHWKHYSTFDPSCDDDAMILIDPTPDEARWKLAAAWDPIESVMTRAGLGPRRTWAWSRLETGQEASIVLEEDTCLVMADPPLILFPHGDPGLRIYGLDPGLAIGIADSLRNILSRHPAVADRLRQADQPIICRLELNATPSSAAGPDGAEVSLGVHPSRPHFRLAMDSGWLRLLLADRQAAHELLGAGLSGALLRLETRTGSSHELEALAEDWRRAWNRTPVVALLQQGPSLSRGGSQHALPRFGAIQHRARSRLARTLRRRGTSPGIYRGDAARQLCQESLTEACHEALNDAIGTWSPAATRMVLAELNSAEAARADRDRELELGLGSPWGLKVRERARHDIDVGRDTRPLRLLVEWLLARPTSGGVEPDREDIAEAAELADVLLRLGTVRAGANVGLHEARIEVSPTALLAIAPDVEHEDSLDLPAFIEASWTHSVRISEHDLGAKTDAILREVEQGENDFTRLTDLDLPVSLRRVDEAIRQDIGSGIDGLVAVLSSASSLEPGQDGLATANRVSFLDSVADWSGLPFAVIDAATSHVSMSTAVLAREEIRYWETERRQNRLVARPLIDQDGWLLVAPSCAHVAQRVLGDAFLDGRLPWPKRVMSQSLIDELARHRASLGRALERGATAVVATEGLPHRAHLEPHHASAAGFHIPGEIDLLIADRVGRIWVCETKDVGRSVSPSATRARVRDFTGAHFRVLGSKVSAIRAASSEVSTLLGIPGHESRDVRGLFVTRHVEPAAFLRFTPFPFTVIDDLLDLLRCDSPPVSGHFRIGNR